MVPALDLELVKTFLIVVESEGFKTAAERLNKTPAAISMQVKRLESLLGKRVLERSNQGISVTSAGEVLREKGQRLLSLNYELLGDFRESDLRGRVSFGSPADYSPVILKKLIPVFRRDFPTASPTIVLDVSRILRSRVQSGSLDMAIVANESEHSEGHILWSEEIAWFGNAVTREGKPNVGVLSSNCVLRDRALDDLDALRCEHTIALETGAVSSLRDAVEAGYCQAFLPVSISSGLERSKSLGTTEAMVLTFSLIFGSTVDPRVASTIAAKFARALEG